MTHSEGSEYKLVQGFSQLVAHAMLEQWQLALKRLEEIKKYIEKRVYLAHQHAFHHLIVAQHQINVENP